MTTEPMLSYSRTSEGMAEIEIHINRWIMKITRVPDMVDELNKIPNVQAIAIPNHARISCQVTYSGEPAIEMSETVNWPLDEPVWELAHAIFAGIMASIPDQTQRILIQPSMNEFMEVLDTFGKQTID